MKFVRASHGGREFYAILEGDTLKPLRQAPYLGVEADGTACRLKEARLLAPVLPSKIVAVGKNYKDHAAEMGGEAPADPLLFLKPATTVIGPGDEIDYPPDCKRLDYECELGVIIGKRCKDVPPGASGDVIFGYTCLNDVTARDIQSADGQWTRGKSYDTFCPLGPWIETDIDPADATVETRLNGEVKQHSSTAHMIHSVDKIVYYASRVMTLLPGDVIATGTPAGIGPMQPGDTVEVEVGGIGVLRNTIKK